MNNLGMLYYQRGEYTKGAAWMARSCKGGNKNAAYNLGLFYMNGFGVEKDMDRARYAFL
jgi:TPR repeat protein